MSFKIILILHVGVSQEGLRSHHLHDALGATVDLLLWAV